MTTKNPMEQIRDVLDSFATAQEKLFCIVNIVRASTDWVCVPNEPSYEMLKASAIEWTSLCHGYAPESGHAKFITQIYKAMIAAAQQEKPDEQ